MTTKFLNIDSICSLLGVPAPKGHPTSGEPFVDAEFDCEIVVPSSASGGSRGEHLVSVIAEFRTAHDAVATACWTGSMWDWEDRSNWQRNAAQNTSLDITSTVAIVVT